MEFAKEVHHPRRRDGDVDPHCPLRGNVLVEVLLRDTEVVQGPGLVLDLQRQLLAGLAPEERRGEVVVVGLQVHLGLALHLLGAMIRERQVAQLDGPCLGLGRRRRPRGGAGGGESRRQGGTSRT